MSYDPENLRAVTEEKEITSIEELSDSSDSSNSSFDSSSIDSYDDSSELATDEEILEAELMDPQQHERNMILMERIINSEINDSYGGLLPLRTKNEIVDLVISKPEIDLKPETNIKLIGTILHIVENYVVIKSINSGENQVLDSDTVLLLEGPEVFGTIFETIGPVSQPLYVVRFNNENEFNKEKTVEGASVYAADGYIHYVFPDQIRQFKGCDASNINDEEVDENERDFSDDEQEIWHKKTLRQENAREHGELENPKQIGKRAFRSDASSSNTVTNGSNNNTRRRNSHRGGRGAGLRQQPRYPDDSFGYNILPRPKNFLPPPS
ncbi:9052_t:CDS:2 [Dentiscutata erythropus]|uniref:H/ACA ribonucleoprotein complex subunit n=1 Tax=Dentiscutata erythropus TaxID=1348616 RepID=A0A9N9D856_9GLOM|nr:9052_t:CDS:2 [Dentiscutata erythropus]